MATAAPALLDHLGLETTRCVVWGERYLLDVSRTGRHLIEIGANIIWVIAPSNSDADTRRRVLERWY